MTNNTSASREHERKVEPFTTAKYTNGSETSRSAHHRCRSHEQRLMTTFVANASSPNAEARSNIDGRRLTNAQTQGTAQKHYSVERRKRAPVGQQVEQRHDVCSLTPALSRCRPRKPVWRKPVPGSRLERVVGLHAMPSKLPERPVAQTYRTTPAVTNRSPGVRKPNPKCQPHDAEAPPSDAAWAKRPPNEACRWSACAAAHCAGPRQSDAR